jgi:HAD superfamily hydrolase (TIGR01493 family)
LTSRRRCHRRSRQPTDPHVLVPVVLLCDGPDGPRHHLHRATEKYRAPPLDPAPSRRQRDRNAPQLHVAQDRRLAPFVDVAPTLARLQDAGVRLGVLSNGDSEMLETVLVTSGLHRYIDLVLSAEQVQAFKTFPAVYALGPRALKLPPEEILFVSSNCWDVCGAAWFGYTSFWVNRLDAPLERLGVTPQGSGPDLSAAADFLLEFDQRNRTELSA